MRITVTLETPTTSTDVLVDCDDATPAADLDAALCAEVGMAAGSMVVEPRPAGPRPGPPTGTVADLALRDGMRVGFGSHRPGPPAPSPRGLQLHVVGGPDSGAVFALPLGVHEVGRSGPISWRDHSLSRRHCRVVVTPASATVTDLGSSNGTRVDGADCVAHQPRPWGFGELLEIGDSLVELRAARPADATLQAGEPGWSGLLRPPRIVPSHAPLTVAVPEPPTGGPRGRIPRLVASLVPGGRGAAVRRGSADADYRGALVEAQRRLEAGVREEQARLRSALPDAADTFLTCLLPGRRLWERRRDDADALVLRLGTSDLPSTLTVTGPREGTEHELHAVPVGVALGEAHVLGVAGAPASVDAVLRWTIAQLAAYHPPRDLSMSFLTTRGGPEWSWLRWLPHLRPDEPDGCLVMLGNDTETVTARIATLTALLKARKDTLAEVGTPGAAAFAAHVVVLHGYAAMRGVLGLGQILEEGPSVGIYAICADDSELSLPERCTATFVLDAANPSYAALRRSGRAPVDRVRVEGVATAWSDRVARELAPLRDVGAQQGETLPERARLLELARMEPPTADAVRARWMLEPRSATMTLGVGRDGPFGVDLSADGPHGLVVGAPGSGKTELLRTMVASLAIANRPEWLNLVLVDHQRGAGFKECVDLPHTVGTLDHLDRPLVGRVLASLEAETQRRRSLLAEARVKDADEYQEMQAREPHRPLLPRLVLVIDELDELAAELPELVTGLEGLAQHGRALGLHVLVAAQRAGEVPPALLDAAHLRIALRVADVAESTDVLRAGDAARIPRSAPGRGCARLGSGAPVAFQAGRVGGRRPGAIATDRPAPYVAQVGWPVLGHAAPRPSRAREDSVDTDLAALVRAVSDAAAQEGVAAQRVPWLPLSPE